MIIVFQKISGGQLPRGGKAFVGVLGNNEPESNPIPVFSDFTLQDEIVSSSGIDLDSDGFPLLNGQRVNLYVASDYSFMIRDSDGARFWKEARQVNIPATSSFDPEADQVITGEWIFDIAGNKSNFATNDLTLTAAELIVDGVLDHESLNSTAITISNIIQSAVGNVAIQQCILEDSGDAIVQSLIQTGANGVFTSLSSTASEGTFSVGATTSISWDAPKVILTAALPDGTIISPPAGLSVGEMWADTTDSAVHPIIRRSTVST